MRLCRFFVNNKQTPDATRRRTGYSLDYSFYSLFEEITESWNSNSIITKHHLAQAFFCSTDSSSPKRVQLSKLSHFFFSSAHSPISLFHLFAARFVFGWSSEIVCVIYEFPDVDSFFLRCHTSVRNNFRTGREPVPQVYHRVTACSQYAAGISSKQQHSTKKTVIKRNHKQRARSH